MPHHSAVLRTQRPGSRPSSASTGRRSDPVPGWRLRADPGVLSDGSENPSVKRHVEGQGEMGKTWITWITNDTCGTQIVELTNRITWFSPGKTLGIDLWTNFKERIEFLARTWGFKQQRWGHFHTLPHKNADRIDPSTNGKWICVGVFCHHFFQKDRPTHGNHHAHGEICCNHEGNQWLKDQMTRSWAAAPHDSHDGPIFSSMAERATGISRRLESTVPTLGETNHWEAWPYMALTILAVPMDMTIQMQNWSVTVNIIELFFFKRSYIHEWLSWTSNLVS